MTHDTKVAVQLAKVLLKSNETLVDAYVEQTEALNRLLAVAGQPPIDIGEVHIQAMTLGYTTRSLIQTLEAK
jgi:hypothetical protein